VTDPADSGWDCHVHVFDAAAPCLPGHYRPAHRPLQAIETLAAAHGVKHLVLVQPSVYGTDNSVMLKALQDEPGRHRGVAVVADGVSSAELAALHTAGVRGVRFNRVSPVGEGGDLHQRFTALAPRLRELGWHVQWYTSADQLPAVAELHATSGLSCVLDHLGGFGAGIAADHAGWQAAEALADQGAWLKLSGWYRLNAQAPYHGLRPQIQRLARLFGERLVWGSDWPHTAFKPDALPSYASTWQPVVDALGIKRAQALRQRRPAIYA
jgi:predicted TIM-barrel fold metal-dependent hydrolase